MIQPLQVLTPQGSGLLASILGMVIGSLIPQMLKHDPHVHHRLRNGHLANDMEGSPLAH
jgi:hypothetical protein